MTSVTWAGKELKSFRRITLAPGTSVVVDLELRAADCTLVTNDGRRVVEPGAFEVLVGPGSRDRDLLVAGLRIRWPIRRSYGRS
ncbi:MAG: fibronectin type III-like domain-contianing protein [Nakamurella sp.]